MTCCGSTGWTSPTRAGVWKIRTSSSACCMRACATRAPRFAAPVFHLWHRENDRSRLPENRKRLDELLHSNRIAAALGLDQYTRADA